MPRLFLLSILFLLCTACSKKSYVLDSGFSSSAIPPAPDYSKSEHWASLPDKVDAADSIPKKSGLKDLQAAAKADVFFVHPTIFTDEPKNQYKWNADVSDIDLSRQIQLSTILNQASIFNGACRIYAPYYRQAHLYSFHTPNPKDGEPMVKVPVPVTPAVLHFGHRLQATKSSSA